MKERVWRRPTLGEKISLSVLIILVLLPIIFLLLAPDLWGWAFFTALYLWPSMGMITFHALRGKSWPLIVGGPGVSWAGQNHSIGGGSRAGQP